MAEFQLQRPERVDDLLSQAFNLFGISQPRVTTQCAKLVGNLIEIVRQRIVAAKLTRNVLDLA